MIKRICPSEVNGVISAPSSKSYAQRALVAAMLAKGVSRLINIESNADTDAMLKAIQTLGAKVELRDREYYITGGFGSVAGDVLVGESGLGARMLLPVASLLDREITVRGEGTLLKRPMFGVCDTLRKLGVEVCAGIEDHLPITVKGTLRGGEIEVDGSYGSQFITGLLMALPLAECDSILRVENLKSRPYVAMTIEMLAKFGVTIENQEYKKFIIRGRQSYIPCDYKVEGDWSGTSALLVAGAIAGRVKIGNLNVQSLQPDRKILDVLNQVGCEVILYEDSVEVAHRELRCFEFDATDSPDLFPSLVALAARCEGVSEIKGAERLLHKESNRGRVSQEEFAKLGVRVEFSTADTMRIYGSGAERYGRDSVVVNSHNDHRIAMSLAVFALACGHEVAIEGAEAVSKSYPGFWGDLSAIVK